MFYQSVQTLENISFLVFGNPDETLALVFEILHKTHWTFENTFLHVLKGPSCFITA